MWGGWKIELELRWPEQPFNKAAEGSEVKRGSWRWATLCENEKKRERERGNYHLQTVPEHHLEPYLWVTFGFDGASECRIEVAGALLMFDEVTYLRSSLVVFETSVFIGVRICGSK